MVHVPIDSSTHHPEFYTGFWSLQNNRSQEKVHLKLCESYLFVNSQPPKQQKIWRTSEVPSLYISIYLNTKIFVQNYV